MDRIGKKKLDEASTWGGYKKRLEEWGGRIPVARAPEDIRILVAGGAGKHSAWIPTFGATYSQTCRIGRGGARARADRAGAPEHHVVQPLRSEP